MMNIPVRLQGVRLRWPGSTLAPIGGQTVRRITKGAAKGPKKTGEHSFQVSLAVRVLCGKWAHFGSRTKLEADAAPFGRSNPIY